MQTHTHQRRQFSVLQGVCVCTLLLGVVACTTTGPNDAQHGTSEPTLGTVIQVRDPREIPERPITKYRPSPEEMVAISAVEARLLTKCAVADGHNSEFKQAPSLLDGYRASVTRDRYFSPLWGLFSPTASSRGYSVAHNQVQMVAGFAPDIPPTVVTQCDKAVATQLPHGEFSWTLQGTTWMPDGGPPVPQEDSRFVDAQNKWRECMKTAGHPTQDSPAALMAASTPPVDAGPSAQNITQAQADVRCKQETNLVGIGAAVQAAYDNEYIDKHRSELEDYQRKFADFLKTP